MLEHKSVPWVQIPCLRRSGPTSLQLSMLRPKSKQSLASVLISSWTLHTLLPTLCGAKARDGNLSTTPEKVDKVRPALCSGNWSETQETVLKTLLGRCFSGQPHTPTIPILSCLSPFPHLSVTLLLNKAPLQAFKRSLSPFKAWRLL